MVVCYRKIYNISIYFYEPCELILDQIKEGRRFTPIFRRLTFLVAFGVVLVELCVIVYVRVASPCQHNHNDVLVSKSHRADVVPGTTCKRRRECLYVTVGPLCL